MKVCLASKSPRRIELLKEIFEDFEIYNSDIDETISIDKSCEEECMRLSELKARAAYKVFPNYLIISGDTVVCSPDNEKLSKPADYRESFNMLKKLNGKKHCVFSAITLIYKGKIITEYDKSIVKFKELSDREIEEYIKKYNPLDKAGSYGIQDGVLVEEIEGDYNNIVGMNLKLLKKMLAKI